MRKTDDVEAYPGRRLLALVGLALLGAVAGLMVTSRTAGACDCRTHGWKVRLQSVTSDTGGATHEAFWPEEGFLWAYPGHASISLREVETGVVWYVGAGQ
jgi:hypothetical protein